MLASHVASENTQAWTSLGEELTSLRQHVAARSLPDEGMRGSAADNAKSAAAADSKVHALIAAGLRSCGKSAIPCDQRMDHAGVAAAIVRSIAVMPADSQRLAAELSTPLVEALEAVMDNGNPVEAQQRALGWIIPGIMRLAQHRECHASLLRVGLTPCHPLHTLLARIASDAAHRESWRGSDGHSPAVVRLDLVACIALGFLSETLGPAASLVPTEAIPSLVVLLKLRLEAPAGIDAAERLVSTRSFLGLPMFYRPRFVLQALRWLTFHSADHATTACHTELPALLSGLLRGDLANDSPDNTPYGTEDAIAVAHPLATALLAHAERIGGPPAVRLALDGLPRRA